MSTSSPGVNKRIADRRIGDTFQSIRAKFTKPFKDGERALVQSDALLGKLDNACAEPPSKSTP